MMQRPGQSTTSERRALTTRAVRRSYEIRVSKRVAFGGITLAVLALLALFAPLLVPPHSASTPLLTNLSLINLPPGAQGHVLGTDYLGRDVLAEAVWGARASLGVGVLAAALAVGFGSIYGAVSAFAGGAIDSIMMRVVDGLLAIPNIILLLALNSLISTPALLAQLPPWVLQMFQVSSFSYGLLPLATVIVAISGTTWLEAARVARGKIIAVKAEEFVTAARALGIGGLRMIGCHLLPNASSVILVESTLLVSDAILLESGLSYLGLGLGPATPSWGSMLNSGQLSILQGNWWAVIVPGALITLTVLAVTLLGEGWLETIGARGQHA